MRISDRSPDDRGPRIALFVAVASLILLAACGPADVNDRGFQISEPLPTGALETVQQAARVCADGPTVDGIDVSTYQGNINWPRVAQTSVKFAIVRIGDGLGGDDQFENNWRGAREAGLIRGAYQFFRTLRDPDAMADIVIRAVGRLGPGDLPVVLDLEGASIQDQPGNVVAANARRWLDAVEAGTGKRPIIYTGFYVWRDQVGDPDFSEYPLWIAAYVNHCPDISNHWNRWTFWQTSSSGDIPGINGNVDTDLFNGDLAALQRLADGGGAAYGARFEAQSFPYASETIELTAGESLDGWFDMRNTGTATWGENTRFAPTPRDQPGPFGPEGWLNETRISACPQATPPGEVCRFSVRLTAHTPGETTQYFGLVEDGQAWFSDPGQGGPRDDQLAVKINVSPAPVVPDAAAPPTTPPPPDAGSGGGGAGGGGAGGGGAGGHVLPAGDATASNGGSPTPAEDAGADPGTDAEPRLDDTADALPRGPSGRPLSAVRQSRMEGGCRTAPGLAPAGTILLLTLPWAVRIRRCRRGPRRAD